MPAIKIKSTHKESQGEFVLIDEENFDPKKHELYVENQPEPERVASTKHKKSESK